jgi:hypothetical protein
MSGASLLLAAAAGQAGSGAGTAGTIAPATWANISGFTSVQNAPVTLSITGGGASIAAANSGPASLSYILNGALPSVVYVAPFKVKNGDRLAWEIDSAGAGLETGTITLTNSVTSAAVGSFTYKVRDS